MARAAKRTPIRSRRPDDLADRILETAMALGEEDGWDHVRLREVASRLDIPLSGVLDHYRDLDAVADAWFDRAWRAMLDPTPDGFEELPPPERLEIVMMRWFDALAPHRRITGQMLAAKMWCAHPHHWVSAVFNLSRTVLWIREAARLDAAGRQRQVEEIGLTGLFVATLRVWLRDESEHQQRTRDFLNRRLRGADRLMAIWTARRAVRHGEEHGSGTAET